MDSRSYICWIAELYAILFKNAFLAFFSPCGVYIKIDLLLHDTANTRNPQSWQMFMYELLRQTPIFAFGYIEIKASKNQQQQEKEEELKETSESESKMEKETERKKTKHLSYLQAL